MASTQTSSLSRVDSRVDTALEKPLAPDAFPKQVDHAPGRLLGCSVERLHIKVDDGPDGKVTGFLHLPKPWRPEMHSKVAAVMVSGAGGGVTGPSSMYLSMADKLASLSAQHAMLAMRLDYRYPARNQYCVADVKAAVDYLERERHIEKVVLVGWSFGSAPVLTLGGMDQRVVGAALVAPQTAETDGVRNMPPRSVLLLHGTGDKTLSPTCSRKLKEVYEDENTDGLGDAKVKLFEGDDHALTQHATEAEALITRFILRRAGIDVDKGVLGTVEKTLLPADRAEKVELMREGGDLRGGEHIE